MDKVKILELKKKVKDYKTLDINEEDTKNGLIQPFLRLFGWDFANLNEIKSQQKGKDGSTPDYLLKIDSKTVLIVEAKPINFNLDNEKEILGKLKYFNTHDCPLLLITNGNIYRFYYNDIKGNNYKDKLLFEFQLESDGELDLVKLIAKNDFKLLEYAKLVKYQKYVKIALNSIFKNPPIEFLDMINANLIDNKNELDKLSYDDIIETLKSFEITTTPKFEIKKKLDISVEKLNTKNVYQLDQKITSTKSSQLLDEFLAYLKDLGFEFNVIQKKKYLNLLHKQIVVCQIYLRKEWLLINLPFTEDHYREIENEQSGLLKKSTETKKESKFKYEHNLWGKGSFDIALNLLKKSYEFQTTIRNRG